MTGFPSDLWSRQSTAIRSTDRLAYFDVHATSQYDRVFKQGGTDNVTTVFMGDGPPDKYQTTGRIDSTDWRTGQPRTDVPVIMCTHIQVVYSGVNITLAEHLRTDDLLLSDRCAALSTRFEKSDHRTDAAVIVSGLGQVQLAQNASHVLLDGAFGEPQLMGNAGVGAPLCHQRQNLVFPRTEGSKRICALTS